MKTLIAYATSQGCTEIIASKMKEDLGENTTIVNLKRNTNPSITNYQRIIIGGSIRSGQIHKKVKTFCSSNLDALQKKELGLFICCMETGEEANYQLLNAFPEELRIAAKSTAIISGSIDFSRLNFIRKLITRKSSGLRYKNSKVDYEAVRNFTRRMDRIFNPFLFLT
jgi:menaquinone-dependent protoporphyrinogen oxidase